MEKLQKALSKARQDRAAQGAAPRRAAPDTPAASAAARAPAPSATDAAWAGLAPIELDDAHLTENMVMTYSARPDANPFDVLRTKIFLAMRENGWKRLAVTSPDVGCGKTTIACNLAVGFARQREVRAMLFDTDLRRPNISKVLGCTPEHDLPQMLSGEVSPQEQFLRLRDNVALSLTRSPVEDPSQVLLANSTARSLSEVETLFDPDIMIFDLPPMLVTDDARAVLKNVDCALIVVRSEKTRMARLDQCEREIAEYTNVLGVALNDCRNVSREDSHYGY
ncbi:CpsD/CapB family tyrosine-protein kinase [Poseidonocella sedimentorum]|uniref:Chromosome partitioning ATPase, Mrp family, contains Fe-S cluster n=1 Tax=Poseidonocella sedimentorum TaxID=871652 RepID=A0A1I6ENM4_9RHOB|nr:CpsD/CapB family tyrosine-protein kinase [Poseidonocella sedimentorum]SFR19285.1 Chromosome partitioning ATPase, Mrp family, contains Fe-S cluster [Poseidonocella sedimentorum]